VADACFSHLLSHQCGLAVLDIKADLFDHPAVVAAIEAQVPAWLPGDGHGYHPRTYGSLLDEPVRRLTGMSLGRFWRHALADPLDLDFWIGLPEEEWSRVARLYPGRAGKGVHEDAFYLEMTSEGTYTRRAFGSPAGLRSIQEMNDPLVWSAGLPAMGGVGTATALGKFYQVLLGSVASPVSAAIRHAVATPLSAADDRVLLRPTVFTCGAQRDPLDAAGHKLRRIYGPSITAFGHPGAGGSHAFADPRSGISFAYTMNQMNVGVMPGDKCLEMVEALFSES
jgi:CubicO group peptidase (beta-lactamase class C family)